MSALDAGSFFDAIARRYDRTFAPDAVATAKDLSPFLALLAASTPSSERVALDLGCGTGRAWPHLIGAGLRVIGLDASASMLAEASKRVSAAEVTCLCADLYARWPIEDRSIDVVIALHSVLAHPPGEPRGCWREVGREVRRVCRPGALIAIDLPEPSWARRNLRPIGGERYVFRSDDGREVVAVIPEPNEVIEALDLPLTKTPCLTGARAVGRL